MPTLRIVTDSTCDLPPEVVDEYGITVVPNYVNIGPQSYLEGAELPRNEFYKRLPGFTHFPKTAGPGVDAYRQVYERLVGEGARHILSIHVAGAFSSIFNTARQAAQAIQDLQGVPVTVLDSYSVTLGLGFQVLEAAKAALAGRSVADIAALLRNKAQRTFIFAALDTVEYLRRSGRATRIQAGLATFLHIFPVVQVFMGEVSLERIRTRARSVERLGQHLRELAPVENVAILHTNALEKVATVRRMIEPYLPPGLPVWTGLATPAIGSHVGPDAVGLVIVRSVKGI